ncbi:unnamed protein product [Amoebophrya sp. A25]|nr:unnamed protein product [Amoebophrya sp. A25]|eukprot:GSA25T00025559001.1
MLSHFLSESSPTRGVLESLQMGDLKGAAIAADITTFDGLWEYYRSAVTVFFMFVLFYSPIYLTYQVLLSISNKIVYGDARGDPVETEYDSTESCAVPSEEKIALRTKRLPFGTFTKSAIATAIFALICSKEPLVWRAAAADIFGAYYEYARTEINPVYFMVVVASVVHYGTLWFLSIPCLMCPFVPTLSKTKIQTHKAAASWRDWVWVGGALIANAIFIQGPLAFGIYTYIKMFNIPVEWSEVFSLESALPRLYCCMAIDDAVHFWGHYFFHTRMYWYKTVHKHHHSYPNPFGLEAEFAHPIETLTLGSGFFLAAHVNVNHFIFIFAWMYVRVCQTTDVHMGYSAPVFPWRYIIPFWGGVEHHDFHHRYFTANYAPCFEWWDRCMATDIPYEKFRVKEALRKAENRLKKQELAKYGTVIPWLSPAVITKDKLAAAGKVQGTAGDDNTSSASTKSASSASETEKMQTKIAQADYASAYAGEQRMLAPKSCAITGGAGLVGRELLRMLAVRGCKKIVVLDVAKEPDWFASEAAGVEKVYQQVDITSPTAVSDLAAAFEGLECVLHLAALVGPYFRHEEYTKVNIDGAKAVLKACEKAKVKALVDVTSPSTRMDGYSMEGLDEEDMTRVQKSMSSYTHEYARTKAVGEKIILDAHGKSSVKTCAVGPHQVYGDEDQLFMPKILKSMKRLRQFGADPMVISFTHVSNIAHGTLLAARALLDDSEKVGGEFFIVTDGLASSFWNRIDEAREVTYGESVPSFFHKMYVPKKFMLLLASVVDFITYYGVLFASCGNRDKAVKSSTLTPFAVNMLQIHRYLDTSKAKHVLGYLPLVDGNEAWPKACKAVYKRLGL